ncbi:MAG: hypothetical protein AABZ15_08420 [Nitrospirota bacterium]
MGIARTVRTNSFVSVAVLMVSIAVSACSSGGGGVVAAPPALCAADLVCGAPSGTGGDEICVSGRVVEGADHSQGITSAVTGSIEVRIYEPVNFLADPTTLPFRRLTTANGFLDTCGRFTARFSVTPVTGDAPNGVIAITATDLVGTITPNYILGTSQYRVLANTNVTGARTFLVSNAQDQAWATDAGLSSGTFASAGTLAVRYHQGGSAGDAIPGVPVKGVVPKWNNVTDTSKDYFLSDSALTTLQTFSTLQNETGSNGISFLTLGSSINNAGAGTACIKLGGGAGTLTVIGPTLTGTTVGAIVFFNLEVSCL